MTAKIGTINSAAMTIIKSVWALLKFDVREMKVFPRKVWDPNIEFNVEIMDSLIEQRSWNIKPFLF